MVERVQYDEIEAAMVDLLDGEVLKNALAFVASLREMELYPVLLPYEMDRGKTVGCKIPYDGHYLGWILIRDNGEWRVQVFNYLDFGEDVHSQEGDEEFKKAVYDHVKICGAPCHDECWRAKDVKIFGREFKSVCSQHSHDFVNPDEKARTHLLKLFAYSKQTTPYPQQYHPNFL